MRDVTSARSSPASGRKPSPQRFDVFGFRFTFSSPDATATALVRRLYGRFGVATGGSRAHFSLAFDTGTGAWRSMLGAQVLCEKPCLSPVLHELEYAICARVLRSAGCMILHGALVRGHSRAALLIGESGAGKSTLALALAARGYRVEGDDIALYDPLYGAIRALPRCVHLDGASWRLLIAAGLRVPDLARRHNFVSPSDLGASGEAVESIDEIVLLSLGPSSQHPIEPISQASMAMALLAEAGWEGMPMEAALTAIGRLVGAARCHRAGRDELSGTTQAVASLLGPPDQSRARCSSER